MENIIKIIKEIQSTSGRIDKENLIKENKDNEEFKQLLIYALDPYIVFGIGAKKLKKFIGKATGENNEFEDLFHLLHYLTLHNTGNDVTLMKVAEFINAESNEVTKEFYSQVITKSLKIGATAKTINKAFSETVIPEFNVLLAKKFEDEEYKVKGKEFIITEKLDGMRVIMYVHNGIVKFFSRQGQAITGLEEISADAKYLPNSVYDGELLIKDADSYKDRDVLQQTLKIARKDGVKKGLVLHLFDIVEIDEFHEGKSHKVYSERKSELIEIIEELSFPHITYVPNLYKGIDLSVIPPLLDEMNQKGKEGLMLNLSDGLWEGKRSDQLLKIKSMNTMDCKVIGFEEGTGKYKGMLGKIIVDYKGFPLGCGSGFDDEQRSEIWKNKDEYINKIAEIQYFRESKSDKGNLSVSFPVFKQWRFDKDEPSYY